MLFAECTCQSCKTDFAFVLSCQKRPAKENLRTVVCYVNDLVKPPITLFAKVVNEKHVIADDEEYSAKCHKKIGESGSGYTASYHHRAHKAEKAYVEDSRFLNRACIGLTCFEINQRDHECDAEHNKQYQRIDKLYIVNKHRSH